MNRREFIKRSLGGIVVGSVLLIAGCNDRSIVGHYNEGYVESGNPPPVKSEPGSNGNSRITNDIEYYIQTDKKDYRLGEKVQMLYRITNLKSEPHVFNFESNQWYGFDISAGEIIWQWSYDKAFLNVPTNFQLNPGEHKEFIENWNMVYMFANIVGKQVEPRSYRIKGYLFFAPFIIQNNYTSVSVSINIKPK